MMRATLLLASLLLPTTVSATPTAQFVARWQAASQAQTVPGRSAEQVLATPELKALMDEFAAVAGTYRRQVMAARAAGRPPRACPPATVDLTVAAVIAEVRTLPAPWQAREFADSFGAVMDRRYPCASSALAG